MSPALAALAVFPGLALGGFLNVVAARVPLKRSLVRPGPACMSCKAPIVWYDNIPLISYFALRGRRRSCGARIGLVYPAVEITAAVLVAGCLLAFGLTFYAAISAIDIEHRIVPDRIVLPATLIVLAAQLVRDPSLEWPLAAFLAALFLFI